VLQAILRPVCPGGALVIGERLDVPGVLDLRAAIEVRRLADFLPEFKQAQAKS